MEDKQITQLKVCNLVIKDDKVLLIKEWSERKRGYYWNIIKGTFEREKDYSLINCAKREILEEANLAATPTDFLGIIGKNGFSTRIYFGFLCKPVPIAGNHTPTSIEQIDDQDVKEIKWFKSSEISKIPKDQYANDVGYYFIKKWLNGEKYSLNILKEIILSSDAP